MDVVPWALSLRPKGQHQISKVAKVCGGRDHSREGMGADLLVSRGCR